MKEDFSWILKYWSRQNLMKHMHRQSIDGGEMYNALLQDVLDVVQKAIVGILKDSHHTH